MSSPQVFKSLKLKPGLLANLDQLGYKAMTQVQAQALPHVLAGTDVLAQAKTGSGKTAAFGLGLLNSLDVKSFRVQALVLCPTRELAEQVAQEIRRLARGIDNVKVLSLCGGQPLGPQIGSLQHSAHVIVGTPGRVLKHLGKQTLTLFGLKTLVLDEADRMLDMGFTDELDEILTYLPVRRQTLLFSATYPDAILQISARVQHKPLKIDVTDTEQPAEIRQLWCSAIPKQRPEQLLAALRRFGGELNLVFCNTKVDCAEVGAYLRGQGIVAVALHGDLEQPKRTEVLVRFANRSANVLIATDVAARGLDIKQLDVVFNYELPTQPEVYVHRIGRTGRAGEQGLAVSLVAQRELVRLQRIEELQPDRPIKHQVLAVATADEGPQYDQQEPLTAPNMVTLEISGGRKSKLRPGDILGALTAQGGIPGAAVGVIDLFDSKGYVAVETRHYKNALTQLNGKKIKGRQFRARLIGAIQNH